MLLDDQTAMMLVSVTIVTVLSILALAVPTSVRKKSVE